MPEDIEPGFRQFNRVFERYVGSCIIATVSSKFIIATWQWYFLQPPRPGYFAFIFGNAVLWICITASFVILIGLSYVFNLHRALKNAINTIDNLTAQHENAPLQPISNSNQMPIDIIIHDQTNQPRSLSKGGLAVEIHPHSEIWHKPFIMLPLSEMETGSLKIQSGELGGNPFILSTGFTYQDHAGWRIFECERTITPLVSIYITGYTLPSAFQVITRLTTHPLYFEYVESAKNYIPKIQSPST